MAHDEILVHLETSAQGSDFVLEQLSEGFQQLKIVSIQRHKLSRPLRYLHASLAVMVEHGQLKHKKYKHVTYAVGHAL